jgi:hypothetical protein
VPHLAFQKLISYLDRTLNPTEQQKIEAHLATCSHCKDELNRAHRTLAAMREDDLVAPEPNLLDRLTAAFRHKQKRLPQRPQRGALLEFDSWTKMTPLGVRGTIQERQLLFSESNFDLDLQIVKDPATDAFVLRGQLLGRDSDDTFEPDHLAGIELHLTGADDVERRGLTDELGQFSFSHLPRGTYTLRVMLDDHDITLESLELKD